MLRKTDRNPAPDYSFRFPKRSPLLFLHSNMSPYVARLTNSVSFFIPGCEGRRAALRSGPDDHGGAVNVVVLGSDVTVWLWWWWWAGFAVTADIEAGSGKVIVGMRTLLIGSVALVCICARACPTSIRTASVLSIWLVIVKLLRLVRQKEFVLKSGI